MWIGARRNPTTRPESRFLIPGLSPLLHRKRIVELASLEPLKQRLVYGAEEGADGFDERPQAIARVVGLAAVVKGTPGARLGTSRRPWAFMRLSPLPSRAQQCNPPRASRTRLALGCTWCARRSHR